MAELRADHPALRAKTTIFLKSIKQPEQTKTILKSAKSNAKLGGRKDVIQKGRWTGMVLYQLLLEERKTCPSTCQQWANCYGNNMFLAHRIDHTSDQFLPMLEEELAALSIKHAQGFVVRLHVLGDFYSKSYVRFWLRMLKRHPQLHLFGYSHRWPEHADGIGKVIEELNAAGAFIRFSDRGGAMSANVGIATGPDDIQCPQEVGKTESCLTCALCWQTEKPVKFLPH